MRGLGPAHALHPCTLCRVRDSRTARTFTPLQEPKNPRCCSYGIPSLFSDQTATHFDGYARSPLDRVHSSRSAHASRIARPAPANLWAHAPRVPHRLQYALPRHRWSPPLAPLACAVKRQHELDGQSYGARAGGASTCWVSPVASKDAQAVSRGATTIRAIWQRRRHVGQRICSLYVFEVCVGMAPLDNLRSKFSESYRVR